MIASQLAPQLKRLRLSGILATLEVRNEQAIREQWSYEEFLTRLLQDEVERRAQKQLALCIRRSGINPTKTLESFDFTFNPTINRQQVYDLATCAFLRQHRNVLICGQTGVGKSHLAQAVAHEAARQGFDILLTTAHGMLKHLHAGRADGSQDKRLAGYPLGVVRPDLLIIDDFGLKPLPPSGPSDLYDVINERYERASILLTSNRAPSEWQELFGDPLLTFSRVGPPGRPGDRADHHRTELPAHAKGGAADRHAVIPPSPLASRPERRTRTCYWRDDTAGAIIHGVVQLGRKSVVTSSRKLTGIPPGKRPLGPLGGPGHRAHHHRAELSAQPKGGALLPGRAAPPPLAPCLDRQPRSCSPRDQRPGVPPTVVLWFSLAAHRRPACTGNGRHPLATCQGPTFSQTLTPSDRLRRKGVPPTNL